MSRTAIAAFVLVFAGGLCFLASVGEAMRRPAFVPSSRWAEWKAWSYQASPRRPEGDFDVAFRPEGSPRGRARIAFCVQDENNHYFLEIGPEHVWFGAVESGVEHFLCRADRRPADLMGARVVIQRRSLRISLVADGRQAASAHDERFHQGGVAFGGRDCGFELKAVHVQPVNDIFFADDFMRAENEPSPWSVASGTWQTRVLKNPGLSVNAFSYVGSGRPGVAITGESFWSDVEFRAACRPGGSAAVGLYVAWKSPSDYCLFRWRSRKDPMPARQFVRCRDGVETVLAESPGGHDADQWSQLSAWYGGGWVDVRIDDTPVFQVWDDGLTHGRVGLYVDGEGAVEFDDVLVEGRSAFADDFGRSGRGRWTPQGGSWSYLAEGPAWSGYASGRRMLVRAPDTALNVAGDPRWRDGEASVRLDRWDSGALGLAFAVTDSADYYSAEWDGTGIELCKTIAGRRTVLGSVARPRPRDPVRLTARLDHGRITLLVDGEAVLSVYDRELRGGQIGLLARGAPMGLFDWVAFRPLATLPPVLAFHELFAQERSMEVWSDALSDWSTHRPTPPAGGTQAVAAGPGYEVSSWHRAFVPGDVRLELKLAEPLAAGQEVALLASGDGVSAASGYALAVRPDDKTGDADGAFRLALLRQGKAVAETPFRWTSGVENLALVRSGVALVGVVGGRDLLTWPDPAPLRGERVGFASRGRGVSFGDFLIYSRNVLNYTFQNAPVDWRVGGGQWEVSNRWQCDPRWSFFSGRGSRNVALWSKRRFMGDMTLEFFAGIQMDSQRGSRYEYASDINAAICADGRDLTSGYSFLFGGFGNTTTRMYRGTTVLAENPNARIAGQSHHRHWYYVHISRRGGALRMSVDNQEVFHVQDPQPLPGGHIAIWTRDNGIMVARVRVSAEEVTDRESADVPAPALCRSVYDPPLPAR